MHVLVNAASAHLGGSVTYLRNILPWLAESKGDSFEVFAPRETAKSLPTADNVHVLSYPYENTSGISRLYFDQIYVPRFVREHAVDVLFSTTGFGTFVVSCKQALLVRNAAYFDPLFHAKYRELGRSLRRNTLRRWHSLLSIYCADVVLFPTQSMKDMVEAYVSLPSFEVIHYGFDRATFLGGSSESLPIAERVEGWKGDGYKIALNVSTYAVQKNYETLIEALPLLEQKGQKTKLLLTLSRERTTDKVEYDRLMERVQELGVNDSIELLGYVGYQQLSELYALSDVYVFPSFSESFGHSMVEAMALGLPVVAADTPGNREICGDAGLFFSTFDPRSCAEEIHRALSDLDSPVSKALISHVRADQFSWERYVEDLLQVFRTAPGHEGRRKPKHMLLHG